MRTLTADTRQRIVDAAAKLFAVQRFHEVRMEDLAAAAEVGKGTIYRYFHDKEDLYRGLIATAAEQILQDVDRRLADVEQPQAKLVAILQAAFDFFETHPYLSDLLQRVEALNPSDETFAWTPVRKEFARRVATILADKTLAVADPASAALMLLGAMRQVHRFGKRPLSSKMVEQVVSTFLYGAAKSRPCAK
jgi:AcrR family transcriptional regulator